MRDWEPFDDALRDAAADLPPSEETVQAVTPFRTAVRYVTAGLCLSFLTLNGWYLQYLLPALGTFLTYLGFRSLRNNSRWFRFCWIISICEVIFLYIDVILLATRLLDVPVLTGLSILLRGALFWCLHRGLCQAAAETGHDPKGAPALWALVWYGVLVVFGLFWPVPGWIPFLGAAIAFVCILLSLLRVGRQLSQWGYETRAAPVHVSAGRLTAASIAALLALAVSLSLLANHLPAEAETAPLPSAETADIRAHLEGLGFPADLLAQLPSEELSKLVGADFCEISLDAWGDSTDNGVRYTDIQVRIAPETFRCYHFFTVNTPAAGLQNLLTVEPDSSAETVSDPAGQILWERDGTRYAADLTLSLDSYTAPLWGRTYETYTALFSYPFFTEARQGWAACTVSFPEDRRSACAILRYQTQSLRNLFPYRPLPEQPMVGMLNDMESQSYSYYDIAPEAPPPAG